MSVKTFQVEVTLYLSSLRYQGCSFRPCSNIYLSFSAFDKIKVTNNYKADFPVILCDTIKFTRIFTCYRSYSDVIDCLCCLPFTIELHECSGGCGERSCAYFDSNMRDISGISSTIPKFIDRQQVVFRNKSVMEDCCDIVLTFSSNSRICCTSTDPCCDPCESISRRCSRTKWISNCSTRPSYSRSSCVSFCPPKCDPCSPCCSCSSCSPCPPRYRSYSICSPCPPRRRSCSSICSPCPPRRRSCSPPCSPCPPRFSSICSPCPPTRLSCTPCPPRRRSCSPPSCCSPSRLYSSRRSPCFTRKYRSYSPTCPVTAFSDCIPKSLLSSCQSGVTKSFNNEVSRLTNNIREVSEQIHYLTKMHNEMCCQGSKKQSRRSIPKVTSLLGSTGVGGGISTVEVPNSTVATPSVIDVDTHMDHLSNNNRRNSSYFSSKLNNPTRFGKFY